MQRTLITRKNWICDYYHINWMNSKKSEAVVWMYSVKKVFLKISQNSQKNKALLVAASVRYEYAVNVRFTQGLPQLVFTFFN